MELYIAVIGIGVCIGLNIVGLWMIDRTLRTQSEAILGLVIGTIEVVSDQVTAEHKKTRKETQEIKTRLTQVRKDLNMFEKRKPIDKRLFKVK